MRHACVLAPDLFYSAIDWLMTRVKSGGGFGIRIGKDTFNDLDLAEGRSRSPAGLAHA